MPQHASLTARCLTHVCAFASSGALEGVWFNAHRARDGQWTPAEKVARTPDGSIAAYVAQNGHGTYPSPGVRTSHGLAVDSCSLSPLGWHLLCSCHCYPAAIIDTLHLCRTVKGPASRPSPDRLATPC